MRVPSIGKFLLVIGALAVLAACGDPTNPPGGDNQPNAFSFPAVTDAAPNTEITSEEVTLAGFTGELNARATNGTLIVDGEPVTSPTGVRAGQTVAVMVTSGGFGESVTAIVSVGARSAEFTVTTIAEPTELTVTSFGLDDDPVPGETATLRWTVVGGEYTTLTLTQTVPTDTGETETTYIAVPAGDESVDVVIPEGVPSVSYSLSVSNDEETDQATEEVTLELWVCEAGSAWDMSEYVGDGEEDTALFDLLTDVLGAGFTCDDLRGLQELDSGNFEGSAGEITSLVGLQHAVALEVLDLQFNQIEDLSPLANLETLTVLNLDRNRVTDVSPLAGLTNLVELGLWDNGPLWTSEEEEEGPLTEASSADGITDITPLAGLTNLEILYLSNNNIEDISALKNMTSLRIFFALTNRISDISPLEGLTELRTVRIGYQRTNPNITDLSPLVGLDNLAVLELQYAHEADIGPLTDMQGLYAVNLEGVGMGVEGLELLAGGLTVGSGAITEEMHTAWAVSEYPAPTVVLNCNGLDTTDTVTSGFVDDLVDAGFTVEGFTAEDQDCGDDPVAASLESFMQLHGTPGLR